MLSLLDLHFDHGQAAVDLSLEIAEGECVALMGPSGSGKSTLLNLVAGFLLPSRGDIRFLDSSLLGLRPADRPMTILFQENNLFSHLSAWDNIAIGLQPGLRLDETQRQRVASALAEVGLDGLAKRLPAELSGGQRQRVAIARVMIRERPILLLDEAFGGLDAELRLDLLGRIRRLTDQRRLCVLFATHQEDEARVLADHIVRLRVDAAGCARDSRLTP